MRTALIIWNAFFAAFNAVALVAAVINEHVLLSLLHFILFGTFVYLLGRRIEEKR